MTTITAPIPTTRLWRRRERRSIPPFPTSDGALQACAFAIQANSPFIKEEKHYLEESVLEEGVQGRFKLAIDQELLMRETGIDLDSIELAIVARDVSRRSYDVLEKWSITSVPEYWAMKQPIPSHEGVEMVIVASLAKNLRPTVNTAYRVGSVLARRVFSVRPQVEKFKFPLVAAEFEDDALWEIEWFPEADFTENIDSVLEVRVNDKAYDRLRLLFALNQGSGLVIATILAADIFEAIARRVLSQEDVLEQGEEGLIGQILSGLEKSTGRTPSEIVQRALSEQMDDFRSDVQAMFEIADVIAKIDPNKANL